jgi:hypothetical protein
MLKVRADARLDSAAVHLRWGIDAGKAKESKAAAGDTAERDNFDNEPLVVKYLIIGGGAAGLAALKAIRAVDPKGTVCIFLCSASNGCWRCAQQRSAEQTTDPDRFDDRF